MQSKAFIFEIIHTNQNVNGCWKHGEEKGSGTEVGQKAVLGVWGRDTEREKLERFNFRC